MTIAWQLLLRLGRAGRLKIALLGLVSLLLLTVSLGFSPAAAANSPAQNVAACQQGSFFGLIPWYAYIGNHLHIDPTTHQCEVRCFNLLDESNSTGICKGPSDIPLVLLAIVDDLLRIAGLVSVGFVIYGAFRYTASQGNTEGTAKAQATVINALLGLAIAVIAVAAVGFLGSKIGNVSGP